MKLQIKSLKISNPEGHMLQCDNMVFAVPAPSVQKAIAILRKQLTEIHAKWRRNTFHGSIEIKQGVK